MASKIKQREAAKKLAIIKAVCDVAGAIIRIRTEYSNSPALYVDAMCYVAAKAGGGILEAIRAAPAKVLTAQGKIDKRRYRRHVTKHKRLKTIRINRLDTTMTKDYPYPYAATSEP